MLGTRTNFVYPRLVLKDLDISPMPPHATREDIVARYSMCVLDWERQEDVVRLRFEQHDARKNNPDWVYTPTLPEPYDTIVKAAVFAINKDFLNEITRNVQCAWKEFNTWRRLGSSNLSELGWGAGIEHLWYAFYLLGDCAYDSETNWFVRGPKKSILQFAMPFKFWGHQTGDGMIWEHAKLDRLRKWNDAWGRLRHDDPNAQAEWVEIEAFLAAMEAHCQLYLDNRNEKGIEIPIEDMK